jgi:hypothetical protein
MVLAADYLRVKAIDYARAGHLAGPTHIRQGLINLILIPARDGVEGAPGKFADVAAPLSHELVRAEDVRDDPVIVNGVALDAGDLALFSANALVFDDGHVSLPCLGNQRGNPADGVNIYNQSLGCQVLKQKVVI